MTIHLINEQESWALESVEGYLLLNQSNLSALKDFPNVIFTKSLLSKCGNELNQVGVISGGGSGHEPAHIGFVGEGMLSAVVCGNLFASPSVSAILSAITLVWKYKKGGILLVVKNYTGDRLNFGLAAKRAQLKGIQVDWVLVDDDVALIETENDNSVGRRGLCGTVFVHKIATALAQQGRQLKEIKEVIENILKSNSLRTINVSLISRVSLSDQTTIRKNDRQIEIGLGIHGESGRRRIDVCKSRELVKLIFNEYLFAKQTHSKKCCLMVNNLGGLSNLELHLVLKDCFEYFKSEKTDVELKRVYCDTLMTSLNMNGFSVTILLLNNDDQLLDLLDYKTTAPSWPKTVCVDMSMIEYVSFDESLQALQNISNAEHCYYKFKNHIKDKVKIIFESVFKDIISNKDYLNELDADCGDGDCGDSLANVSQKILQQIDSIDFHFPFKMLLFCSEMFENGGGTLCILLALYFSAAANAFRLVSVDDTSVSEWIQILYAAVEAGLNAVQEYGRAKLGQRSIVDPLDAIRAELKAYINSDKLIEIKELIESLRNAAHQKTEETAHMRPKVGRASYVDWRLIKRPDAGAFAIYLIMNSIYNSIVLLD
jgi:dihydroxyacetone kinase